MASIRDDLRIVERQTANATRIAIKLMELLQMLINMKTFADKDSLEVLQALKDYVDKGGELIGDQIKTENKELFMDILKEKGVTALAIDSVDPEGNEITFITYRDCDNKAMREVRDQFKYELKIGISEMIPMDFAQKNSGKMGATIEGLSRAEVELFKMEIADKDIPYCIIQNGNLYDVAVLLKDREQALNAIKDVEYDLSGKDVRDYGGKPESYTTRKNHNKPDIIKTLSDIPLDIQVVIQNAIENKGLTESVVVGGCLAYSKKDAKDIEDILNESLYSDMTALKALEIRFLYEFKEVIALEHPPLDVQYLVDINNPDYAIKLDEEGVTVYKDGDDTFDINRQDEGYEDTLTKLINTMGRPVALTRSEMEVDHKQRIDNIKRKIQHLNDDFDNNLAVKYLKDMEKFEKNAIHGDVKDSDPGLNLRQKEALKRVSRMTVREDTIDKDVIDKFTDIAIEQKAEREVMDMSER